MLDHMLFNKLKWWNSKDEPLIGKTCRVKNAVKTSAYTFENGNAYAKYNLYNLNAQLDITGGEILGEQKSAKFDDGSIHHMISYDSRGKWWLKLEDCEISGD